jgi:hypothetical protein
VTVRNATIGKYRVTVRNATIRLLHRRLAQGLLFSMSALLEHQRTTKTTHELLLPEKVHVTHTNDHLADQAEPELPMSERVICPSRHVPDGWVGEYVAWTDLVGCRSPVHLLGQLQERSEMNYLAIMTTHEPRS